MFSCITETFFVWLYVFGYNHHFVFQLLAVSTIFCRKFFQVYPPNIRQISVNIHHILPQICSSHSVAMNKFPLFCSLRWPYLPRFGHRYDRISSKYKKYRHLWNSIPNISKFLWFLEWFIRMSRNLRTR